MGVGVDNYCEQGSRGSLRLSAHLPHIFVRIRIDQETSSPSEVLTLVVSVPSIAFMLAMLLGSLALLEGLRRKVIGVLSHTARGFKSSRRVFRKKLLVTRAHDAWNSAACQGRCMTLRTAGGEAAGAEM